MVTELKKAQAGHYAVPLFDTVEMKGFEGTLAARRITKSTTAMPNPMMSGLNIQVKASR